MKFTFFGHACFQIETMGKKLLFDPFITPNNLASHINISSIHPDYIFISHAHSDHISDLIEIAKASGARVISVFEIHSWLNQNGVTNTHPMNTGGSVNLDFGNVKLTNAIHSSSFQDGSYGGNPVGFVISTEEGSFFYSGDTALTLDFKLLADEFSLNFAVLPIGDNFTMGIDDAIRCADFINCKKIIGVHYDTFGYIVIDKNKAIEKFKMAEKELILLNIGEEISI